MRGIRTDLHGRGHYYYHGVPTQHQPNEIYFLDNFLSIHHFKSIIEIGTRYGGLTTLFGIHANLNNGKVLTLDINTERVNLPEFIPNMFFYGVDCFAKPAIDMIKEFLMDGRTLIYCDGGNKINEFNYFATLLKPNDYIMAHDRGHEIRIQNIEDAVQNNNLVPIYEEEIKKLKCRIFAFRKENP